MFSTERRVHAVDQQHHHAHPAYQPDQGGVNDSLAGVPEPAVISHGLQSHAHLGIEVSSGYIEKCPCLIQRVCVCARDAN